MVFHDPSSDSARETAPSPGGARAGARRSALVTGANKGIGKEVARQLTDAGLTVHLGSRDAARGQRAVDELGSDARLLVLDVTDANSIADAARQVPDLDILVNNAGIQLGGGPASATDVGTFRATFETNFFAVVSVTNAFLPALRRSSSPRIVNVSSETASLSGLDGRDPHLSSGGIAAAYRTSKAALNSLTVMYAQALAPDGIKVNALGPGLRATDMVPEAVDPELAAAMAAAGDPAEGAAGVVRLALLPDDGPTGGFFSWDGSTIPW